MHPFGTGHALAGFGDCAELPVVQPRFEGKVLSQNRRAGY